jgi:hypothetical protein
MVVVSKTTIEHCILLVLGHGCGFFWIEVSQTDVFHGTPPLVGGQQRNRSRWIVHRIVVGRRENRQPDEFFIRGWSGLLAHPYANSLGFSSVPLARHLDDARILETERFGCDSRTASNVCQKFVHARCSASDHAVRSWSSQHRRSEDGSRICRRLIVRVTTSPFTGTAGAGKCRGSHLQVRGWAAKAAIPR